MIDSVATTLVWPRQPPQHDREPTARRSGSVLLVALLVLGGVLLLGLALLEISTANVVSDDLSVARLRAEALAEGAIELAYSRLREAPTFRGRLGVTETPAGMWAAEVVSAGADVEILGVGYADGVRREVLALATVSGVGSSREIDKSVLVHGDVGLDTSTISWSKGFEYAGTLTSVSSTRTGTLTKDASVPPPVIDVVSLVSAADQVITGSTNWKEHTSTGVTVIQGDLKISNGTVKVDGILVVDGSLALEGTSAGLIAGASGSAIVLVTGDFEIKNLPTTNLVATLVIEGDFVGTKLDAVNGTGALVVGGAVSLNQVELNWIGPTVPVKLPAEVSGVGTETESTVELVEQWRRPTATGRLPEVGAAKYK